MQILPKIFFLILTFHISIAILAKSPSSFSSTTTSVKDFGVVGNGSADDTYAVQSAINSSFTRVKFPAGGAYHVKTLYVPAGVQLAVDEGSAILGSGELKDPYRECWRVALAARGGGVFVSGGGNINGTTLVYVWKGGDHADKDVNVRWTQKTRDLKMRVRPDNFCIICDHTFRCDRVRPGHW